MAVAASGRTPYTLGDRARRRPDAAPRSSPSSTPPARPLAALADVAVEVEVGPEVLRGSTRLTAGTAQKVALNALTTAAMVRLGRVHGDLMIDVGRGQRQAAATARPASSPRSPDCSLDQAAAALDACGGNTRAAVVHLVLGLLAG